MIKATDQIFKIYSTEELSSVDYFSYFGWEGAGSFAFEIISDSYKNAAQLVFQKIQNEKRSNCIIDSLIYPLFFCYRHSIELYLKAIYFKYIQTDESSKISFLKKGHNLEKLWEAVKPILERFREQQFERFSANIDALDSYIKQINKFDDSSMLMRYPNNKDLSSNKEKTRLDVFNLNTCLSNLLCVLNNINCEMGSIPQVESFDKTDREQFLSKILENKSFIDHIIEVSNHGSSNSEEFKIVSFCEINLGRTPSSARESLHAATSEQLMLVDVLFYAGEKSKTINWPKDISLKKERFLDRCCFFMKNFKFSFKEDVNRDEVNILSKADSAIRKNLLDAMSFFPEF